MDKSKIEQIKQENAAAKIQGMKVLKILLLIVGAVIGVIGVLSFFTSGFSKLGAVIILAVGFVMILFGFLSGDKSANKTVVAKASSQYGGDVSECQATYAKIVELVKRDSMKAEFGYIAEEVKKDVDTAADLANKLTNINKIIDENESLNILQEKLAKAQAENPTDDMKIKSLEEKIQFAQTMNNNRQTLELQLQRIKQNISTVYTKLMVLDTTDTTKVSETGEEIQKLLDRKITAQKFEQEL